jgi:shikimate kinase/3-dehydroquinate synthase
MAAGKTTVGRELAARLGVPFADLDERIERRESASVAEIFARRGESVFRDLERRELARLAVAEPGVVALGGGTVLPDANRRTIRRAGRLVWLDTDRSTILARLRGEPSARPLCVDAASAVRLLAERRAVYEDCDLRIRPRPGQGPQEVAALIAARLSR